MSFVGARDRDDLKQAIAWLHTVSLSEVKPWNEFVSGFEPPSKGWQQLEKQVAVNFAYFAGNYLWVAIACQLVSAVSAPLLVVILPVCVVLCGIVFRPPRALREPLAQLLQDDTQRGLACAVGLACLLLLSGLLSRVLTTLAFSAGLVIAHAFTKKITSRSRLSKMWFNVRFFGNRSAEDLPESGAAQHPHEAGPTGVEQAGADTWSSAGPETLLPQAAPPQASRMQVGSTSAVDVDDIDLEAGSTTVPARRPPAVKRD